MNRTLITGGNLVFRDRIEAGSLLIEDGKIIAVFPKAFTPELESCAKLDVGGMYVSAGFIDIHVHGGGGHDFMDGTEEAVEYAAKAHLEHGTTTIYPTTLACSMQELYNLFDTFRAVRERIKNGPNMPGLHLEAPYFNPVQAGAQDPRYIKNPDPKEYHDILRYADGLIARWSAAPELDGAMLFGKTMSENGVLASIAHSNATYEQVQEAYQNGFTHITHLYSAMSTIVRIGGYRHLGVVESAYIIDGMTVEIIADGAHLPSELLGMIYKLKGSDKICLVTDSMRGAGMPDGPSRLGSMKDGQEVILEGGVAKLLDRSAFAGSIATTDRLVRVMTKQAGVPLWESVKMMTEIPAKIMGLSTKGELKPGYDADIVVFNDNIEMHKIIVNGNILHTGI